jgi:hypothetical protein
MCSASRNTTDIESTTPGCASTPNGKTGQGRFQKFLLAAVVAVLLWWRFESIIDQQNKNIIAPAQLQAIEDGLKRINETNHAPPGLPQNPPPPMAATAPSR